jgi:hypothetical protein
MVTPAIAMRSTRPITNLLYIPPPDIAQVFLQTIIPKLISPSFNQTSKGMHSKGAMQRCPGNLPD